MMTIVYAKPINANFGSQELSLVTENNRLDWNKDPVMVTDNEIMDFSKKVVPILRGDIIKPSEVAGINSNELFHCARTIDQTYNEAIQEYKIDRDNAFAADLEIITTLRNKSSTPIIYGTVTGLGGGAFLAAFLFGPLVLAIGAGAFLGAGAGLYGTNKVLNSSIAREGSVNRIKWMQTIAVKEQMRFRTVGMMIENRCRPLIRELSSMRENNEISQIKLKELKQLSRIYNACVFDVCLNNILSVEGVNVENFVRESEGLVLNT